MISGRIHSSFSVSNMKMSFRIFFLPSPSLPPKMMRYLPKLVEEWQFLEEGASPLILVVNKAYIIKHGPVKFFFLEFWDFTRLGLALTSGSHEHVFDC